MVSCLKFRTVNHFKFIFIYGVRECSNFIVSHVTIQPSQHYLLKRSSFLHCIFLPPLSQIECRCMGLFLNFPICFIDICVCVIFLNLLPISHNRCFQAWDRSDLSICGLCECVHVGAGLGPGLSCFHSLHSGSRCLTTTVLAPDSRGSGLVKTMPERHQGQLLSYPWLRWD